MDTQRGKQLVLKAATRLGVQDQLLDLHRQRNYELEVDERIREFDLPEEERRGKVLFPMLKGADVVTVWTYGILAHAFQSRGYEPVIVQCGKDLDRCHAKQREGIRSDDEVACAICTNFGRGVLGEFGFQPLQLSEMLPETYTMPEFTGDIDSVERNGIPLSKYAMASTRQFVQKYHIDLNDAEERDVYLGFLRSAALLADAAHNVFSENDFTAVVGHHPAYINGGIFLEAAARHDIPAAGFDNGYQDQKLLFGRQSNVSPLAQFTDHDYVKQEIATPLSEKDQQDLVAVLDEFRGNAASPFPVEEIQNADRSIDSDQSKRTIGLFANLIWDVSLEANQRELFEPFTWFEESIDYLGGRDDVELVIKTHPVEASAGSNEPVSEWIREQYPNLPDNVEVLEPDTDVSPYLLMDDLDIGIVYNSTLGLEMACSGIPVVVVGDTHYRDLGFTFEPEDPEEYREMLVSRPLQMDESKIARARRYAHLLFVRKQIPFPFFEQHRVHQTSVLPVSHDEVKPGNSNFDLLVDRIISNDPVVAPR